jgi:hypothetical protein
MSRRDPKNTQEQIQALLDSAMPPYNPLTPHVPIDAPISLSSLSTSTDRRHVRSYDMAAALEAFKERDSELVPDLVKDNDKLAEPDDADVHQYDSLCRECTTLCELRIPQPPARVPRRTIDWENPTPSGQVFKFTVNGQVAFQGRLQTTHCIHDRDRGPCQNKAVFGAGHCWQHLLWRKNLRIKQAEHGRGLFA